MEKAVTATATDEPEQGIQTPSSNEDELGRRDSGTLLH